MGRQPEVALSGRKATALAAAAAAGCALLVLLAAGLPTGYPVNDDAAYHRMVDLWWQSGRPTFIGWNEMTLLGHLAPAVVLRALGAGSLVARQLMIGAGALALTALACGLLIRSGARPGEAMPASLIWLANPLTLLSATCFMTELPQALWCFCWLAAFTAWCRQPRAATAVAWTASAFAAFSVRQTGVVLPLAAAAACLAMRSRRRKTLALAAAVLAADAALWIYRESLPLASIRPLADLAVGLEPATLIATVSRQSAEALATLGLLLIPVAVASLARRGRSSVTLRGAMVAIGVALVLVAAGSRFPFWPNTLTASGLLPDTLPNPRALPPLLTEPAWIALTALAVASLAMLASRALDPARLRDPIGVASLAGVVALIAITAIARSPFDRYLVAVIPLALVAATPAAGDDRRRLWPRSASVVLAVALVASALAVRGLHARQRAVWDAAESQVAAGVPATAIDGGFEWNLWHQPAPFSPEELRDPAQSLAWYESYPFTRLNPVRRLWVGAVPGGWRELSRRRIPGGHELLVLERSRPAAPLWADAGGRDEVRREIRDHILASWERGLVRDPTLAQPPLSVREGDDLVFYWDSYFTNVGLIRRPELMPLANANVDFLLQQVRRYGFVPNANREWGLNRSQPPYLALMVRDVWESGGGGDAAWLTAAYRALQREHRFWTTDELERHTTPIPGLLRYSHHATPAEHAEFYDQVLGPRLRLPRSARLGDKTVLAAAFMAEAESGMDFTPRFGGRCDDFIAVDLNVNLVLYEETFAWMVETLGLEGEPDWRALARSRWTLIRDTCWDDQRGLFMDWDFTRRRHGAVASVMAFQPLWAGLASPEEAARTVASLRLFEHQGGVAACEVVDPPSGRQWGEEVVWAPMQHLVVAGLDRYGYHADAVRIASRFLDTVARNWLDPDPAAAWERGRLRRHRQPGTLYEKYTIDGRVSDDEYAAGEGLGWTAGVYLHALDLVSGSSSSRDQ